MGVRPSALEKVFWSHSIEDLKALVSIKSQESMANHFQMYESFRLVVDEALGGGAGRDDAGEGKAVQSFEELARAFADIGGTVG